MKKITSLNNTNIKHVLKLKIKKYRDQYEEYVLEGFKLIDEAYKAKEMIREIYVSSNVTSENTERMTRYEKLQVPIYEVEESIFKRLTSMQNSEGILAIQSFQENRVVDYLNVLLLDRVQDPGNLGTMIRTGDAAGFHNILCSKGSVDIYNEKTIRAAMGSLFHVNLRKDVDLLYEIEKLKEQDYIVIGSELNTNQYYKSINNKGKYALVIGNEANGISEDILRACDIRIKIPIYGQAESLNASVAAGILMYHISEICRS